MKQRTVLIGSLGLLLLAALTLAVFEICCPGSSARALANAGFPRQNPPAGQADIAVLPDGWPLPFMTLPPHTSRARLNALGSPGGLGEDGLCPYSTLRSPFNQGGPDSGRVSLFGLRPLDGFDGLAEHLELELAPKGFARHWDRTEPDGSRGREWISPDSMFIVQLYLWADTGDCHLAVFEYDEPQPKGAKSYAGRALLTLL